MFFETFSEYKLVLRYSDNLFILMTSNKHDSQ